MWAFYLLEEEMIIDQLILIFLGHTGQRIEFSFEISFESIASGNDLLHDLVSLLPGNTWTKREVSKISSNSNSSGVDHLTLLLGEISVLKTLSSHVRDVLGSWAVLVIVFNHLIEQFVELVVRIMRSSINTDTRVLVSNTGENAHLE